MAKFSERYGHVVPRSVLQVNDIDVDLRNRLWNVLKLGFFDSYLGQGTIIDTSNYFTKIVIDAWSNHLKLNLDTFNTVTSSSYVQVRNIFLGMEWYEIYDFIEYLVQRIGPNAYGIDLVAEINNVLEAECADCRIIGNTVTQIVDEIEIQSIESALTSTGGNDLHIIHLETALGLLSSRTSPDYRNSIKESISAVEQVCQRVAGTTSAGVSDALTVIESKHSLHGAFKKALSSLYGYTSDGGGIRHPLNDEGTPSQQDALFMLVACSAFVNYLLALST